MSRGALQGGHELRLRVRHKKPKRMLRSWSSFLSQEQQNSKVKSTGIVDEIYDKAELPTKKCVSTPIQTPKQTSHKSNCTSPGIKEKDTAPCAVMPLTVESNGFTQPKYNHHISSQVEKVVSSRNHTLDHVADAVQRQSLSTHPQEEEEESGDEEAEEEEEERSGDEGDSDLMCSVCNKGESEPPNEIVICDTCNKGFHQVCHLPKISDQVLLPNIPWHCRHCVPVGSVRKSAKSYRNGMREHTFKLGLPYNIKSLEWDSHHRTNMQNCYCYCGGPGEWNKKMLQCQVCQQWFHEACIQSLETPLLYGDRFYNFTCSVCNNGPEIVKRLQLTWVDVTHLTLYNLNVKNSKKYYDLDKQILPFLNSIWLALQLPSDISRSSPRERRCSVFRSLLRETSRFKSGKEVKKRRGLWCLRTKSVPPLPHECVSFQAAKTKERRDERTGKTSGKRTASHKSCSPSPDRDDVRKRKRRKLHNGHTKNTVAHRKLPNGLSRHCVGGTKTSINGMARVPPVGAAGAKSAASFLESLIPTPQTFNGDNHPFRDLDESEPTEVQPGHPSKLNLVDQQDIRTASKRRRRRCLLSASPAPTDTTDSDSSSSDSSDTEIDVMPGIKQPRWHGRSCSSRRTSGPTAHFSVLAKRITLDGKIQYLVQRENT